VTGSAPVEAVNKIMSRQGRLGYKLIFILLALIFLVPMLTACSASGEASDSPGGRISPPGTISIPKHGSQTWTITPDPCYKVDNVTVNGVSVLNQCIANGRVLTYTATDVTTDILIIGYYAKATHIITSGAGTGGSISPLGKVTVNECEDQTFVINPDDCYDIINVTVDGVSMGRLALFTFTNVNSDGHIIEASFAKAHYIIKARALTSGGTIYASSPVSSPDLTYKKGVFDVSVEACSDQTFVIKPDDGYQIDDLQIDGISVAKQSSYTFTDIHDNHTIAVSFAPKITHTILIFSSECCIVVPATQQGAFYSGGGSGFDAVGVDDHGDITFDIIDVSGGSFSLDGSGAMCPVPPAPTPYSGACEVFVDGISVGQATQYTFKDVTMDHRISASSAY
jgi:hypothetical protein